MKTVITIKTLVKNKTKVLLGILMLAVGIGSNMAVKSIDVMADRRGTSVSIPQSLDDEPLDEGSLILPREVGMNYKGFDNLTNKTVVTLSSLNFRHQRQIDSQETKLSTSSRS